MVCVVPEIKVTYDNFRILWNLTNLNSIPYKFVSDYKLLLIMIGQQSAISTYPCPFCFITLDVLRSGEVGPKMVCFEDEGVELEIGEECLKLKTFGDIKESHNFSNLNFAKKFTKDCHSIINLPLFDEPNEMPAYHWKGYYTGTPRNSRHSEPHFFRRTGSLTGTRKCNEMAQKTQFNFQTLSW